MDTDADKIHRNVSLIKEEDLSMEKNTPLFSSPQNRRMSLTRKFKRRTPSGGKGVVGDGGRASIVGGSGVNDQTIGSVPREVALAISPGAIGVAVNASSSIPVGASTAGTVGRGNDDISLVSSKRGFKNSQSSRSNRSGIDRIKELLGTSPILLVDDAVSILKLTKRAIQNECPHIRSTHSYQHT